MQARQVFDRRVNLSTHSPRDACTDRRSWLGSLSEPATSWQPGPRVAITNKLYWLEARAL